MHDGQRGCPFTLNDRKGLTDSLVRLLADKSTLVEFGSYCKHEISNYDIEIVI